MITTKDYDTQAQIELFYDYLTASADIKDRIQASHSLTYKECEWEAFQHGWNAAKLYFSVKGTAL